MPGKLFIVGTPIGNMEDITLRALRALREADIIAAEDTRRTGQLLARHGIGRSVVRGSPDPAQFPTEGLPNQTHGAVRRPAPNSEAGNLNNETARPTIRNYSSCRLVSYHEFNEARRTQELLKELQQGRTVALVTDAGMPTISDPGQRLIQAVLEWNALSVPTPNPSKEGNIRDALPRNKGRPRTELPSSGGAGGGFGDVQPRTENREPRTNNPISLEIIPGPSAVTMAIAASGFSGTGVSPVSPSGAFLFFGFLPHKSTQRRKALTLLAPLPHTLVFFESPYRLVKSLRDMHELLGNRQTVVARELTKKFEEIIRGDLDTILKKLENRSIKGEITVVVEGTKE